MSRKPDDKEKLQAPSIAEIKDAFGIAQKRLARKVSFRKQRMGVGPLLNAIAIHFLSLGEEEQERIAKVGVAHYEALLELDEPVDDPRLPAAKADPRDILDVPPAKLVGEHSLGERRTLPRKGGKAPAVPHPAGRGRGDESE